MAVTSDQEVLNTLKVGNLPNNWNLSLVTDQVDPVDLLVKIHAFNPFAIFLIFDSNVSPLISHR